MRAFCPQLGKCVVLWAQLQKHRSTAPAGCSPPAFGHGFPSSAGREASWGGGGLLFTWATLRQKTVDNHNLYIFLWTHRRQCNTPVTEQLLVQIPECSYTRGGQEKYGSEHTPSYFMTLPSPYPVRREPIPAGGCFTVCVLGSRTNTCLCSLENQGISVKLSMGRLNFPTNSC